MITTIDTKGLFGKYIVQKVDGSELDPGAKYFVLRYDNGPAAQHALYAYADYIEDENPELYRDLQVALGRAVAALARNKS